jgi:hypothetical protein
MTYTISIADHHSSNFTQDETNWPVFNDNQEFCGQIHRIEAWSVPAKVYRKLKISNHLPLYLSTEGHWAPTFEIAEHFLSTQSPPTDFVVKGASLGLFLPNEWLEDNNIKIYADYRVFRNSFGNWDAEKLGALE